MGITSKMGVPPPEWTMVEPSALLSSPTIHSADGPCWPPRTGYAPLTGELSVTPGGSCSSTGLVAAGGAAARERGGGCEKEAFCMDIAWVAWVAGVAGVAWVACGMLVQGRVARDEAAAPANVLWRVGGFKRALKRVVDRGVGDGQSHIAGTVL